MFKEPGPEPGSTRLCIQQDNPFHTLPLHLYDGENSLWPALERMHSYTNEVGKRYGIIVNHYHQSISHVCNVVTDYAVIVCHAASSWILRRWL